MSDLPRNIITQHRWFHHQAGPWSEHGKLPYYLGGR